MCGYQDHIERLENNEHEKIRSLKVELVESRTDNESLRQILGSTEKKLEEYQKDRDSQINKLVESYEGKMAALTKPYDEVKMELHKAKAKVAEHEVTIDKQEIRNKNQG